MRKRKLSQKSSKLCAADPLLCARLKLRMSTELSLTYLKVMHLVELCIWTSRFSSMMRQMITRDKFNIQIKETSTLRVLTHQRKFKDTLPRRLPHLEREKMWGSWMTPMMQPLSKLVNPNERWQQLKRKPPMKWKSGNLFSLTRRGGCQTLPSRPISGSQRSMHTERVTWTLL